MSSNGNGLTGKQRMFVEEYLTNGFNATAAARTVGYQKPNKQGPRLLVNVGVRETIDVRLDAVTMTANEALAKEDEIARFDISDYVDGVGRLAGISINRLKEAGLGHLIREIRHTANGTNVILANPDDARDRILKARGAYKQQIDIGGDFTIRIVEANGTNGNDSGAA